MDTKKENFYRLSPAAGSYQAECLNSGKTISIGDAQKLTPEGAYTTFRTYDKFFVLNLEKHFNRLEETAALAGKQLQIDRKAAAVIITAYLENSADSEYRIRLTLDLTFQPGDLYLVIEPLTTPSEDDYQLGIDVVSTEMHRTNPKAKLNKFLAQASEVKRQKGNRYEEILMLDENKDILEGLSSNFYAIIKGELFTADEGVLSGTTREFVLSLAEKTGIPVHFRPVSILELRHLDEAFITSTSRSILPIRAIDGQRIGPTTPGPVTAKLIRAFKKNLKTALEDIRLV
jgi:branched-chain amino acid aminotransferase